jgi:hypothetical protein
LQSWSGQLRPGRSPPACIRNRDGWNRCPEQATFLGLEANKPGAFKFRLHGSQDQNC